MTKTFSFFSTMFFLVPSTLAFADDVRAIFLSEIDGTRYNKTLIGFSSPETYPDASNAALHYRVRKLETATEGLTAICSSPFESGKEGSAKCHLEFNLSRTSPDLEVFEGKLAKAMVVKFNRPELASKIHRSIGSKPFVASEKVDVVLPTGVIQKSPRIRIECEKTADGGAKNCTLVAVPDQTK